MKLGEKIIDFKLKDHTKAIVMLSDFKGKKVLLSFHPLAWTSICAQQMLSLEKNSKIFAELNTIPLGISVDTVPSKKAWADELGIKEIKLVSDFWPHGEFAKKLDLFRWKDGFSERANIIINENQEIIFHKVYEISKLPDINEVFDFLKNQK